MLLKEAEVSIKQFDKVWDTLPPELRICDEESEKTKEGFVCAPLGNLLLWVNFSQGRENQTVNEEVESELKRVMEDFLKTRQAEDNK